MAKPELCYYTKFKTSGASIYIEKHDGCFDSLTENQKDLFIQAAKQKEGEQSLGIQSLKVFEKWQVSPLGEIKKAEFYPREDLVKR